MRKYAMETNKTAICWRIYRKTLTFAGSWILASFSLPIAIFLGSNFLLSLFPTRDWVDRNISSVGSSSTIWYCAHLRLACLLILLNCSLSLSLYSLPDISFSSRAVLNFRNLPKEIRMGLRLVKSAISCTICNYYIFGAMPSHSCSINCCRFGGSRSSYLSLFTILTTAFSSSSSCQAGFTSIK